MSPRRTREQLERVQRAPGARAEWFHLAELWERSPLRAVEFPRAALSGLLDWIASEPEAELAQRLFFDLSGLEPLKSPWEVPLWWRRKGRSAPGPSGRRDARHGLPLRVVHLRSGLEALWIPPEALSDAKARGFYLARHPVSVETYQRFLAENEALEPIDSLGRHPFSMQRIAPQRPVIYVSRREATEFARWAQGGLPGAQEMLWASRGASQRSRPWTEKTEPEHAVANFRVPWRGGDWERHLEDVGGRPRGAGPFGHEDLLGLVWEWLVDAPESEDPSRRGKIFGGSWGTPVSEAFQIEDLFRPLDPRDRRDDLGFRVLWRLPAPCRAGARTSSPRAGSRRGRTLGRRRRRKRR